MSYFECFSVTVTTIFFLNPKLRLFLVIAVHCAQLSRSSFYRFTFLCLTFGNLVKNNQIVKNYYEYDYQLPKRCFIRGITLWGRDSQELENWPSSHLTQHSTPARGKKLSSSKELAWNLYTVWHKVLENTKQANSSSFSTYFVISVTDANLLTHAEM